jgi:hypothetical protein
MTIDRNGLAAVIADLAATSRIGKIPNWTCRIDLLIEGQPWLTCLAEPGHLVVCPTSEAAGEATTSVSMTGSGVTEWLLHGVDYTHLVRRGELDIISGTYFDLLLLSKALGLRPEKKAEARRGETCSSPTCTCRGKHWSEALAL